MVNIPMPVYASRYTPNMDKIPGDHIQWEIGDPAWAVTPSGKRFAVTADSERMGHTAVPGEPVYECVDETGQRYCYSAKRMSIREGWTPVTGLFAGSADAMLAERKQERP